MMPHGETAPRAVLRRAYRPPAFLVDTVDLHVTLDPAASLVRSRLVVRRNAAHGDRAAPLRLDGEAIDLVSVALDGVALSTNRYTIEADGSLVIADMPDAAVLDIVVRNNPGANSELSGLYLSGGNYFTQCEAEGFRRITYFPDRPDVMARFSCTVMADRARVPVLLSNGNLAETGVEGGMHWARWVDPHPKPAYLFALVAGDLVSVQDRFVTRSGREVALAIYVRRGDETSCGHAMQALKASMKWDEDVYGLEYDLDVFNIAAVSDFNMGAMENKGLNVFNTKYVLARPETATDTDYQQIESVIAHEYFHNWTGNRVTCRDWFQLSLKEGLTVFRDQQFSADQGSPAVNRLHDVRRLRGAQFPEDAGPLAHPVRPDSYLAIDNFYTPTIYEKGAEVVRMMHRMLGEQGFRKGMDLYFARHDNAAVTIEDFVGALQDASGVDLAPFMAWYGQAGTPEVVVSDAYDAAARRYVLTLRQSTAPTPGQPVKAALPIPVAMGLLGPDGAEMVPTTMLVLREAEQSFVFKDVPVAPVPSLLRNYSAPVRLAGLGRERLLFLAAHDRDPFVRWDSFQQYAAALMLEMIADYRKGAALGGALEADAGLLAAMRATLAGADADRAYAAEALMLPGEASIADRMAEVDVEAIHAVRGFLRAAVGRELGEALRAAYEGLADGGPYRPDGASIGRRALRNVCMGYLVAAGDSAVAAAQFGGAGNMTDQIAALAALAQTDTPERVAALASFHAQWRGEELVLDKWFAIQATSALPGTVAAVQALMGHADFDLRNPNRVRALVGAFSASNQIRFHDASGAGYRLLADVLIALDPINGQTAARMLNPLGGWQRHEPGRAALMRGELERILAQPGLSRFSYEKASKSLA